MAVVFADARVATGAVTWSGTTSNAWGTNTNWVGNTLPVATDDTTFGNIAGTNTNVDLGATRAVASLTINASTSIYTIGGVSRSLILSTGLTKLGAADATFSNGSIQAAANAGTITATFGGSGTTTLATTLLNNANTTPTGIFRGVVESGRLVVTASNNTGAYKGQFNNVTTFADSQYDWLISGGVLEARTVSYVGPQREVKIASDAQLQFALSSGTGTVTTQNAVYYNLAGDGPDGTGAMRINYATGLGITSFGVRGDPNASRGGQLGNVAFGLADDATVGIDAGRQFAPNTSGSAWNRNGKTLTFAGGGTLVTSAISGSTLNIADFRSADGTGGNQNDASTSRVGFAPGYAGAVGQLTTTDDLILSGHTYTSGSGASAVTHNDSINGIVNIDVLGNGGAGLANGHDRLQVGSLSGTTSHDLVLGTNVDAFATTLKVDFSDYEFAVGEFTFLGILKAGGNITGAFDQVNLTGIPASIGYSYSLAYDVAGTAGDQVNLVLNVTSVPEPGMATIGGAVALGAFVGRRSRRRTGRATN